MVAAPDRCALCEGVRHRHLIDYDRPPQGETDFAIAPYARSMWQCESCGHIVNRYGFDLARALYEGAYTQATYGPRLRETFARVMALLPERSDNRQRVARIQAYMGGTGLAGRRLLDVGSGLGVFPAAMAAAGWECTALDPDARACDMVAELAGSATLCGDFMTLPPTPGFDLIAFNKVIEHVGDMIAMLARARAWLAPGGVAYVELPDGEAAILDSPDREEFFVEHHAAFSMASAALLVRRSGFSVDVIERVREPSSKYTIRLFARPVP
ncbi:MAG: class I SAM-dependent methyltransferase [Alphaproteobacteria bacterium]|nr:class I SAM-dependent methyltransferase [Alphaproteobacteria bacterium]